MRVENINIYNLKIPFSRTIKHSLYTRNQTQGVVVVLRDQIGNRGVGEGTPREYVTGEKLNDCLMKTTVMSKKIIGEEIGSISGLYTLLKDLGRAGIAIENPAAFCAVETALLDLWAKNEKKSLHQLFIDRNNLKWLSYSGVIPHIRSEKELQKYIELIKLLELTTVKVKVIDLDSGISQLKIIRNKLGSGIDIRVDANSAFTTKTAMTFIKKARAFHLSAIEQPVDKNDLDGLKKVSENSEISIIADESMYTHRGPFYLIDNSICHGLNIRLSSCGGFTKAYDIYQQARLKKMTVVLGAHVGETAILSFAGRHLAMMCPEATYLEGSFSKFVLKEDLVNKDISFGPGGVVPVPTDPGLGIEIQNSAIKKWSSLHASLHTPDPWPPFSE